MPAPYHSRAEYYYGALTKEYDGELPAPESREDYYLLKLIEQMKTLPSGNTVQWITVPLSREVLDGELKVCKIGVQITIDGWFTIQRDGVLSTIGTVPVGYWPDRACIANVVSESGFSGVSSIQTSGAITFLTSPADLIETRQYSIHANYIYGGINNGKTFNGGRN